MISFYTSEYMFAKMIFFGYLLVDEQKFNFMFLFSHRM